MHKDRSKNEDRNDGKCREIKTKLDRVNSHIKVYEDKIRYIKKSVKDMEREKREERAAMKNMMTKYGVSKDLVVGSLIKNSPLSVLKGMYDEGQSPEAREIEEKMENIKKIEGEIKSKEDDIFRIGIDLRETMKERDDLKRQWRYSECSGI